MQHLLTFICGVVTKVCLTCSEFALQARHIYPEHGYGQHIMQLAGARDMMACQAAQWRYRRSEGRKQSFWEVCADFLHSGFAEHLLSDIASIAVLLRRTHV